MTDQTKQSIVKSPKFWIALAAGVVLLVVIVQNTASVETRILFMSVTMPRALLLAVMLAFGFVLGVLTARRRRTQS